MTTRVGLPPEIDEHEIRCLAAAVAPPVALTGATGFVGSHIAETLVRAEIPLRALVRDPAKLLPAVAARATVVRGDLEDGEAVARLVNGAGTVLHVAGLVRAAGAREFDRVNRAGTQAVTGAMRRSSPDAVLVLVSSLAAAGPSHDRRGLSPADVPAPISAYGRSKLAGEEVVRASGLRWSIVRPPVVYGPRDVDVLQFFRLASRGLVPLPAGERWISVIHVSDVVRAVIAAAQRGLGRIHHLGDGEPRTMADLVTHIAGSGQVSTRIVRVPSALVRILGAGGDLLQKCGFSSVSMTADKAREMLAPNWTAQTEESRLALGLPGTVNLASGAAQTWAWYRAQGWVPHAKIAPA